MRNIVLLFSRYYVLLIFIIIEGFAIKNISSSHNYQQVKLNNTTNSIVGGWHEFTNGITSYFNLKYENEKLNKENAILRQKIKSINTYTTDSLLPIYSDSVSYIYLPAKIIDNSLHKSVNYFTINKGKKNGIKKGMGVLTGSGIFGIITNVSDNYALAMSVVSTKSRISVKHKKSGAFGNLTWNGNNAFELQIENISKTVAVSKNDTFVTAGFSSFFPPDIPVAVVKTSKQVQSSGFLELNVTLTNKIDRITNVYVMQYENRPELEILQDTLKVLSE